MNRITKSLLGLLTLVSVTTFAADLKYSVVPNFFEHEPDGKALGACHGGVVLDQAGNIYVTTDTERGIVVYTAKGKFLRARYGIENYFVPEGEGRAIERRVVDGVNQKIDVRVAVDAKGNAGIKAILVNGKMRYEEELL